MSVESYAEFIYLNHILSADFDERTADKWLSAEELQARFAAAMRTAFLDHGYDVGKRYVNIADLVLAGLKEQGIIAEEGDEFTGSYYSFPVVPKDNHIKRILAGHPVATRIQKLGGDALGRALSAIAAREGWTPTTERDRADTGLNSNENELAATGDTMEYVPAADRVVSRTDNMQAVQEIESEIQNLRAALREDNEVGAALADEREIIDLELELTSEVVGRPRFRLQTLVNWVSPALRFLCDKFAGGAIGETAKRLLDLLMGLI